MMNNLLLDLRYSFRLLRKRPGFAMVAIITLALGVGANTAIFSVVDAALLRPLPYKDPGRLVHLWETNRGAEFKEREASYPDYLDYRERNTVFESVAGYGFGSVTLTGGDRPERVRAARVTANFFDTLGVEAALGRTFLPGEDRQNGAALVILGHGLWERRFGADPGIVGQPITLSGRSYTVVGVLPAHFQFAPTEGAELWVNLIPSQTQLSRRQMHWLKVIARLKPDVTPAQVETALAGIAAHIQEVDAQWHAGAGLRSVGLRDQILGDVKPVLFVLLGAVGFVLLIACANVANLMLVRATGRRKEIAIRAALGASRGRIVRQLMVESLVLAAVGGACGLLLAHWGVGVLVAGIPENQLGAMPYLQDLAIDGRVFGFCAAVTLLTGLVFGLAPALQASRPEVHSAMKEGGRTSGGAARRPVRDLLVAAEVALALVLLVGAGLMMTSLLRLLNVDPGFNTDKLLTFQVSLPPNKYTEDSQTLAFHNQMLERLEALPGVSGATTVSVLPLTGGGDTGSVQVEGRPAPTSGDGSEANLRTITPNYFEVMGIPLVRGRFFTERDDMQAPLVVLVNQTLAGRLFPGEDAVGKGIIFSFITNQPRWEIVGVVGDEKVTTLDGATTQVVYFSFLQDASTYMNVAVRTSLPPASLIPAVREQVRALDQEVPTYSEISMGQIIQNAPTTFIRRYPAFLIGEFELVALVLAVVGIYGVISYSVSQRTNEIGIRMALGAQRKDVLRLVMGQGLVLTLAGVGAGLGAALLLTRFLSGLLFGVAATDPLILTAVATLLIAVALAACLIPARRATRVDPMVALRDE